MSIEIFFCQGRIASAPDKRYPMVGGGCNIPPDHGISLGISSRYRLWNFDGWRNKQLDPNISVLTGIRFNRDWHISIISFYLSRPFFFVSIFFIQSTLNPQTLLTMKPTLLAFFVLAICTQVSGQMNKFNIGLEYSPNFTSVSQPYGSRLADSDGAFRFANNLFLKGGYKLMNNLYATGAIGLLGTREFLVLDFGGQMEIDKVESHRFHSYVVAPIGFTYYLGSFYISPEVGIGWNVSNRNKSYWYYTDGSELESEYIDKDNIDNINETTYPLFLSIGNEIRMKSYSILLGVKGYYSLNSLGQRASNAGHYYGFGVVTGVRF